MFLIMEQHIFGIIKELIMDNYIMRYDLSWIGDWGCEIVIACLLLYFGFTFYRNYIKVTETTMNEQELMKRFVMLKTVQKHWRE